MIGNSIPKLRFPIAYRMQVATTVPVMDSPPHVEKYLLQVLPEIDPLQEVTTSLLAQLVAAVQPPQFAVVQLAETFLAVTAPALKLA